jgi:hypothetical protein
MRDMFPSTVKRRRKDDEKRWNMDDHVEGFVEPCLSFSCEFDTPLRSDDLKSCIIVIVDLSTLITQFPKCFACLCSPYALWISRLWYSISADKCTRVTAAS